MTGRMCGLAVDELWSLHVANAAVTKGRFQVGISKQLTRGPVGAAVGVRVAELAAVANVSHRRARGGEKADALVVFGSAVVDTSKHTAMGAQLETLDIATYPCARFRAIRATGSKAQSRRRLTGADSRAQIAGVPVAIYVARTNGMTHVAVHPRGRSCIARVC